MFLKKRQSSIRKLEVKAKITMLKNSGSGLGMEILENSDKMIVDIELAIKYDDENENNTQN